MVEVTPDSFSSTTSAANRKRFVATVATEVQSAVAYLEKSLFVRASELLARVTVAAKDASGKVNWVTLDSAYHSVLVKTAVAVVKTNGPNHSVASIKEALFIFLLDVLNGKPQSGFLASKEVKTRIGVSGLAASKPSGSTRTCLLCEVKFASRKKLSRHSCKVKQANEAPLTKPTGVVTDAKRARRAKARKARRDVVKAEKAKAAAEKSAAELACQETEDAVPVVSEYITFTPPTRLSLLESNPVSPQVSFLFSLIISLISSSSLSFLACPFLPLSSDVLITRTFLILGRQHSNAFHLSFNYDVVGLKPLALTSRSHHQPPFHSFYHLYRAPLTVVVSSILADQHCTTTSTHIPSFDFLGVALFVSGEVRIILIIDAVIRPHFVLPDSHFHLRLVTLPSF
ncbi:hypothetical protein BJY52DRAFT_1210586 [Lactarius psammicola]|nr:hypothetical protein BJY52DRAFT_1210586 [Lactarius psammicola]